MSTAAGEPSPAVKDEAWDALGRFQSGVEDIPVFPLRGADLIGKGIARGPRVGAILAQARQTWLAEGCLTDADAAQDLLRRTLEQAGA